MLTQYLSQTRQLLQNPAAAEALYTTADLTSYVNRGRLQLAGETECVRSYGTLALTYNTQSYPFSSISVDAGIAGVFSIRGATVSAGPGQAWMAPRAFPYFQLYFLNNPVPKLGRPKQYSQYGQGETGTIYVAPVPDNAYSARVDAICVPAALVDDTTVEAIPFPYTDAVPYYAAYLAFLSAQRATDADRLWQQYQTFASRGRQMSNGPVNPMQYPQGHNPVRANQLGMQVQGGQG